MELIEAKILLNNLINRVETVEDGGKQVIGVITASEVEALRIALASLDSVLPKALSTEKVEMKGEADIQQPRTLERSGLDTSPAGIELNTSTLELPVPTGDVRLCLDFGTAMSKATLVRDDPAADFEEINVLELGKPGDQEEISSVMLISSVYIDNEGRLWFGKMAVDRSLLEAGDGTRQRLDNIKRRVSEEGLDEVVGKTFNPTSIPITYGDMVLAYLTFLTWAITHSLANNNFPRNLPRRFALPCLVGDKARETARRMKKLLGEAQILADTFFVNLKDGMPLFDFVAAVTELRSKSRTYPYMLEDITEPLGVAGSLLSWRNRVDMLVIVIDVGAGTSDLSLYRILVDPTSGQNDSREIQGAARGITEAGNYLDRILIELILKKAGITSAHPEWITSRSKLELTIRDYKETLFNEEFVFISLPGLDDVNIDLDEFLALDAVKQFGVSLRKTMQDLLEAAPSWIEWVTAHPNRYLTVALTGGGANLPMVQQLAQGSINVSGKVVRLVPALSFPAWLKDDYPELEIDYPRIAVSVGGARKRLINRGGAAGITADVRETPRLGGYYQKGVQPGLDEGR